MRVLSTDEVHTSARFAYWRELVRDNIVPLDLETPDAPAGFSGTLQSNMLGPLRITLVTANIRRIAHRRPNHIAQARFNRFSLDLLLAGSMRLDHCGHETTILPGAMVLIDSDRPYDAVCSSHQTMLSLSAGGDVLRRHIAAPEDLCGRAIDGSGGLARVLADMLLGLQREADAISTSDAAAASDLVLGMLALATRGSTAPPARGAAAGHLRRAKDIILARLHDPGLAPGDVARAIGVSPRYLRRMFQTEGISAAAWILERRLQRCRAALADPSHAGDSVSRIAMTWGFGDPAHFSRAFRRRFGITPSAARCSPPPE